MNRNFTIHLGLFFLALGCITLSNSYDGQMVGKLLSGGGWWLMGVAQAWYWCVSRQPN